MNTTLGVSSIQDPYTNVKCCLAGYKKLLVLFFLLRVKLFRLAVSRRILCLSLLSVRQDNP